MAPAIARRREGGVTVGSSDNQRLTGGDNSGNNQPGAKKAATGSVKNRNNQIVADKSGNNQAVAKEEISTNFDRSSKGNLDKMRSER